MARPGKPPVGGRFQKGQSGNPKGRPKAAKQAQASAFAIVLDRTIALTENGVAREVPVEEALQRRTYEDAITGSRMAQREILKMIIKREKALAPRGGWNSLRVTSYMEPHDPKNADTALQILGIATRDEGREDNRDSKRVPLLLELWAVQAALTRRRGGERLTDQEISEIKRCTRNAKKLRLPRRHE